MPVACFWVVTLSCVRSLLLQYTAHCLTSVSMVMDMQEQNEQGFGEDEQGCGENEEEREKREAKRGKMDLTNKGLSARARSRVHGTL